MGAIPRRPIIPGLRTPTILGWAGFDGGFRRAVSFARSPKRVDDDPIPKVCPEVAEYTLTIADILLCGCLASGASSPSGAASVLRDATAIDGVYTLSGGGAGGSFDEWQETVASRSFDYYLSSASCGGPPDGTESAPLLALLICKSGRLSFRILQSTDTAFTGQSPYFFLANSITIGAPFDNELTVCDTAVLGQDLAIPSLYVIASATGGTGLIEP